jgi:uncharacterized protein YjgD (DUF1641 family)
MNFSERKGITKPKDIFQKDSMDDDLRNGLWNILFLYLFDRLEYTPGYQYGGPSKLYKLFVNYWNFYFKLRLDSLSEYYDSALDFIKKYFFSCKWYSVYNFIEYTIANYPDETELQFIDAINAVLIRELSAYRVIDNIFVEITAAEEIDSINQALLDNSINHNVYTHLSTALKLMSDRKSPDYRNSIKESISSVEALAKEITKNDKATLGEALKMIDKDDKMHKAFIKSLNSLYGYTSDADGIRHSLLEEDNLNFTDAKFMLVACTAFINYLIGKMAK